MQLLLLRHGIAEDADPSTGHRDAPRPLSTEGARRTERAALGMAALGLAPAVVLTSPLTRCAQTAAIVAARLGGEVREDARLRPGMDRDALEDALLETPDAASIMVCGHQPDLSRVTAALIGGGLVEFKKGALAVLDVRPPRLSGAHLRALHPPAALRALGGEARS